MVLPGRNTPYCGRLLDRTAKRKGAKSAEKARQTRRLPCLCLFVRSLLTGQSGAEICKVAVEGQQLPEALQNLLRQLGAENTLIQRGFALQGQGFFLIPRAQEVGHLSLAAGVLRAGEPSSVIALVS